MKKYSNIKLIAYAFSVIVFCSACNANIPPIPPELSQCENNIALSSYSAIDSPELTDNVVSSTVSQMEDVKIPHIYDEIAFWKNEVLNSYGAMSFNSAPISFNNDKAIFLEDGINPRFDVINSNILLGAQGAYGMQYVTCNLLTGDWFVSEYVASQEYINIWDNNVIGQINTIGQFGSVNIEGVDFRTRPVFLNTRLEKLPLELDFDYGEIFKTMADNPELWSEWTNISMEQYMIMGIAYDAKSDRYIAVYAVNPFWGHPVDNYDGALCELGIVIFNSNGRQLERFQLPEINHPPITTAHSSVVLALYAPRLFVFDNNLLIVPDESAIPPGMDFSYFNENIRHTTILANLETREFSKLSEEETKYILSAELGLEGHITYRWVITKPILAPPFEIIVKDDIHYVYMPGDEMALFAVPAELKFQLWGETDDGMYHAVFSKYN